MALKPWYKVVTPREDLRDGKPLDASEFAVHLDQVRDGRAPAVYQKPERFFERTFLTKGLTGVAAEVLRRLERREDRDVGGLQYDHAVRRRQDPLADAALPPGEQWSQKRRSGRVWPDLLQAAGLNTVPKADVAVFVGTEFDPIAGRGGVDGTPIRKTPWGEIAFQLGGESCAKGTGGARAARRGSGGRRDSRLPAERSAGADPDG